MSSLSDGLSAGLFALVAALGLWIWLTGRHHGDAAVAAFGGMLGAVSLVHAFVYGMVALT